MLLVLLCSSASIHALQDNLDVSDDGLFPANPDPNSLNGGDRSAVKDLTSGTTTGDSGPNADLDSFLSQDGEFIANAAGDGCSPSS